MEKSTSTTTTQPKDQRSSPAMVAAELPSIAIDSDSSTAQLPTPPAVATTDPSSRGRKRALGGNVQMENSNYYKMRVLLKDLRPYVLEVLRTPDFRNCKAAMEIQEKMKLMLQLYQEMIGEPPKREKTIKTDSFLSNGKPINLTTTGSEISYVQTENQNPVGDLYKVVVGGSAFGWNFITSAGTEAVYYGMSKEEYRSSHPIIQMEAEVELHNTS